MGDSTCLMQPFCYASGITNETNESNSIHALGQSVSFGRFMSESLAWEKWSSFSHNRYVEEAERYAKPGSVAQKKAFFEAHYKKLAAQKAAAALLEQANNAAAPNNEGEVVHSTLNSQTSPNSKMVVKEEQDATISKLISEEPDIMLKPTLHDSNSNIEVSNNVSESNNVDGDEKKMKPLIENSMNVGLRNQLEDVITHEEHIEKLSGTRTPQIMTPILKDGSNNDPEVLASMGKKKPPVSSFRLLKATATSKLTSTPIKSAAPISSKRDNIATPMSNNKPSADKKRYTPKSLQMSVNFTPIREINRLTASVMKKFESTRVVAGSSKASKDSLTPLRTPTMAPKEMRKHPSLTPLTEKKRNKTPIDLSDSGNRTAGSKWRLLSSENKTRSPVISSPFNLRTEERAARRQKKLEEKFNANEAQKVQLHTKLKEKTETEIMRKLRQSFCFKAKPLPDFYKERKTSTDETKKDTLAHSESRKEGRKKTPKHNVAESKISLPLNKPSLKNNVTKSYQGNSGCTLIHPLTSYSRMITTHENASPNIQHLNKNDRNYKY
ncbi:PREDICTED: protein WVD2-like 7 isoform X2 [Lupinus angustifolius]|uniref:protein WVD2-like 7 isoform X2 n=1 Tax=Lupinus angustifolius TaxID=3871 RepID=UPI00092EAAF9|nr:PREDICTED: protein WVD2-like 7 isoform X2 [Lupinus angustifolius]